MQHTNPGETWTEWLERIPSADEGTALAALREIILATAQLAVSNGDIALAWAEKKLPGLGIAAPVASVRSYEVEVPVTGTYRRTVFGSSRANALEDFTHATTNNPTLRVEACTVTADPVFTSGPEDNDGPLPDDAPTTVQATLDKLREVIMYAVIAGPHICVLGAQQALVDFGLAPLPTTKQFVITRPVEATMRTTVNAYDEASAEKVASWRWENNRSGWHVSEASPNGDPAVDVN